MKKQEQTQDTQPVDHAAIALMAEIWFQHLIKGDTKTDEKESDKDKV